MFLRVPLTHLDQWLAFSTTFPPEYTCSLTKTVKSLLHTIYFYNGKLFGLRSKEHRNLKFINFRVQSNCIIFDETVSKTYHGGLKDLKYKPRVVKHVCCVDKIEKHFPCLVNCYSKYLENIRSLDKNTRCVIFQTRFQILQYLVIKMYHI